MKRVASLLACAGALLLAPTDARALGPAEAEAGAKVGDGIPLNREPNTILGLGFGLGGRAGVSWSHVYAGLAAVYYFGETKTTDLGVRASLHTLMVGIEVGYDVELLRLLTLRPQLGLGDQEYFSSSDVNPSGKSSSYFYLEPALLGLVPLGSFYVGADAGVRILPEGPPMSPCPDGPGTCHTFHTGLTLHGQVGVRF